MATLRQYFETDLSSTLRVRIAIVTPVGELEGILHFDPVAHTAFLSVYVSDSGRSFDDLAAIVENVRFGESELRLAGRVDLPSLRVFHGDLEIVNEREFHARYRLWGDPTWKTTKDIGTSARVFLYSESDLTEDEVVRLQAEAKQQGQLLQFRSRKYEHERSLREEPLAFLCHDSRDKDDVARPIAEGLQRLLCSVWYDEFSLPVGANLRTAIETGIKKCRRCVLVLSPNFFSNDGWTRKEFDAVFSRELLEGQELVLPVWHGVTKEQVYDYSPGLLNIKGLNIADLGVDKVVHRLYRAIITE